MAKTGENPEKNDIDQLREILFGEQVRETLSRFSSTDKSLEKTRNELIKLLDERAVDLSDRTLALEQHFEENSKKQAKAFENKLAALEQDFEEKLKKLQQESSQKDREIRKEIVAMREALEGQKISRNQMTEILLEMGNRLQGE